MYGGAKRTTLAPATDSSMPFSRQRALTCAGAPDDREAAQQTAAARLGARDPGTRSTSSASCAAEVLAGLRDALEQTFARR